ncbi:MAG: hypothetical protein AAGE59_13830 [Cyanobacteria bacterium P01_F01_bin.86]
MAKLSEQEWRVLFQQHADSGLSANAFCKQHKLCPKYFSLRKKQLQQAESPSTSPTPFVATKGVN